MVKKGNPEHISTLASLSGKSAAVESSTTELAGLQAENKILQKQGKPLITIKSYPADTSAAQAIQATSPPTSLTRRRSSTTSARPTDSSRRPASSSRRPPKGSGRAKATRSERRSPLPSRPCTTTGR